MKGVPADELYLAKLIQNAKAHGMGWCRAAYFRNKEGLHVNKQSDPVRCCARGASFLAPDTYTYEYLGIVTGNDGPDEGDWATSDDNGEDVGHAFKLALSTKTKWGRK